MSTLKFKSLSSRLSVTTSIITSVVVTFIAVYVFLLKSNEVRSRNLRDASLSASNTAMVINQSLVSAQSALAANLWIVERCILYHQSDTLTHVLASLLDFDPNISGCGVAMRINSKEPYIIYSQRESAAVKISMPKVDQLGHSLDFAWLEQARSKEMQTWSTPHPAVSGAGITVCTYSLLVDDDGDAFFFADIPIDVFSRTMCSSLSPSLVEAILIDAPSGGLSISHAYNANGHADAPKLIRTNIDDLLSEIGDSIPLGRQGVIDIEINDREWQALYDVVNQSGWILVFMADITAFSATVSQAALPILSALVATILILFVIIWLVIRHITRPLRLFSDSAIEVSKGNFTVELPEVHSDDEMALLRDSMLTMQKSLVKYTRELEDSTRSQALIMGELQIASRIQDDLLPKAFPAFPDRDDVDIRAVLIPAKQIGGDLYNYFILNDRLYFVIADVSGKSVPAAIIMAIACNVFNTFAPTTDDPSVIMQALNTTTCSNNEMSGFFITALVGILDLSTGQLRLCNAGHEPAIVVHPTGEVNALKIAPNLPVGVLVDKEYESVTLDLAAGARLILSTDGITEAESLDRQFFGFQRLIDCVTMHADDDVASLVSTITDQVMDFSADMDQSDDITLMAIDYRPSDRQMPRQVVLSVDINQLTKIQEFAEEIAQTLNFDRSQTMKLNIALEEAVTNIINYSLMSAKCVNAITVFASVRDHKLSVIICDRGKRFDPTQAEAADTEAPLEERQIGGLGIDMIRRLTDSLQYRFINNRNCLYLTFNF